MEPRSPTGCLKWLVAGVCGYETVAICGSHTPTISTLCHRHRWLAAVILSGLGFHLLSGASVSLPR